MKKRTWIKKIAAGLAMVCLLSPLCVGLTSSVPVYAAVGQTAEIQSSKTYWVYKEVNGKVYIRLYDATNEVWLTDWIECA